MNKLTDRLHIPPYLFPSREYDDDVREIEKKKRFSFGSTTPMLSNAIRASNEKLSRAERPLHKIALRCDWSIW